MPIPTHYVHFAYILLAPCPCTASTLPCTYCVHLTCILCAPCRVHADTVQRERQRSDAGHCGGDGDVLRSGVWGEALPHGWCCAAGEHGMWCKGVCVTNVGRQGLCRQAYGAKRYPTVGAVLQVSAESTTCDLQRMSGQVCVPSAEAAGAVLWARR